MAASMNFTDKTQESLAAAIQLAKDYANAQGKYPGYAFTDEALTSARSTSRPHRLCPPQ